jgi:hypothetical protein
MAFERWSSLRDVLYAVHGAATLKVNHYMEYAKHKGLISNIGGNYGTTD